MSASDGGRVGGAAGRSGSRSHAPRDGPGWYRDSRCLADIAVRPIDSSAAATAIPSPS